MPPPSGQHDRLGAGLAEAASLRDLGRLLTRATLPFGVTAYAIGHLQGADRPTTIFLTTWPRAWMEFYAANAFIKEDGVVAEALASSEPFSWEDARSRHLSGRRVFEAAHAFGFKEGFAVPIHGAGDAKGVVAFAAGRLRMTSANRQAMVAMSMTAYAVARRLFDSQGTPITLSRREREALSLVARGFEDAAIGTALGITRASAHIYVERAKRRLGASTRAQAVALAVADKIL